MIVSIAGNGFAAQAATTRTSGNSENGDNGFAATLSTISQTQATSSGATAAPAAAPGSVLGSPGWFNLLFASPAQEQAFGTDLTQRLQAAGVDTSSPIALTVDSSGHVKAKDGTPGSQAIDAMLASDPTLENTYKKIANTEETTALARAEVAAYGAAGNDTTPGAAWQQYSGAVDAIEANGANLTLANGSLT
jgi:hypothetical protein